MKYLTRDSKRHTTLTYRRRWPSGLQAAAAAIGYGKNYVQPTDCPVDADSLAQAEAQAIGNAGWEQAVALLEVADTQTVGTQVGGVSKAMLSKGRAKAKAKATHDLFSLIELYHAAKPETGKAKLLRERCWSAFCDHMVSNVAAVPKSLEQIHAGLDRWQEDMEGRGLKGTSIERQRNAVTGVLRWASIHYRLGWALELRPIPKEAAKPKAVLTEAEQVRLLETVVAEAGPNTAMVSLMLAGGVMPSEISRLDPETVVATLSAAMPYVIIGGEGQQVKAEARRRVIPVVWSKEVLEVMIRHMPEAIARAAASADPTATVNKWLRTRGFGITGHGLRHTMAAQAGAAMANPMAVARVGGWTGSGLNPVMLGYGAGMGDSELVASLSTEVRRWWRHLLPPEGLKLRAVG